MTERLALLMREEVEQISVPPPSAERILARGRRARRRRTYVRTAVLTCVVLVCLGVVGLNRGPGAERLDGDVRLSDAEQARSAYLEQGAYAIGDDLVIGANRFEWTEPIKALHYTSAGVVIQSGKSADRDEGGSNYALVTPTGEWSDVSVTLDNQVVGFETDSPYLAYAEPVGNAYDLVVHDVVGDDEVARVRVDIGEGNGGWRAPPVAIDGDLVWVHGEEGWTQWNWRTDEVSLIPGTEGTYEVAGGMYADWRDQERWLIRSMTDSSLVRELDLRPGWYGFFSPDGGFMRAFPNDPRGESPVDYEFFSVASGSSWQLRNLVDAHNRVELGWSPDGHVLLLLDDTLSVCQPETGACDEQASGLGDGTVRLGGEPYGS